MTTRLCSTRIVNAIGVVAAVFTTAAVLSAQSPVRTSPVAPDSGPRAPKAASLAIPLQYTIGADDVMSVVFWRDKDMSSEVTVRPDGKITLPLLNDIDAAGLTPTQLKDRIAEEAKKYVTDPTVTVEVKAINSRKVYITGEVRKPGLYPLTGSMTVLQLIAIAGGLDDYAKGDKISIVRNEGGQQASFKFNYKELLKQRNLQQNIELKPGDSILVP